MSEPMRLGEKQELFAILQAKLIIYMYEQGYKVRCGDYYAREGHKNNSNHYIKLACDLNLFKDGAYLTETADHAEFGKYWESLHELCRWGGRFGDGNHYSLIHDGRM